MATPLAFQIGQIADEFKPDFLMALAARREGLSPDQRYLVGQAMLCVNHTINSAFGNNRRAFKKLSHSRSELLKNQLPAVRNLLLLSMQLTAVKWYHLSDGS
jgi:hypothetical protein